MVMAAPTGSQDTAPSDHTEDEPTCCITAHRTNPYRTVFTEENNTDGWISTDLTVELGR